jgi:protein TonB
MFARASTRLPPRTVAARVMQVGASAIVHVVALTLAAVVVSRPPARLTGIAAQPVPPAPVALPRLVFLAPRGVGPRGGGGGGGNGENAPIRRAEGVGHDRATLRTRQSVAMTGTLPQPDATPAVLLDARPLASGHSVQAGLPTGGVSFGTSLGTGSGGGVGTGTGTGIGPGSGPGVGPGAGGGTGGGPYQPGGSVSTPRLLVQVDPHYTSEALERKIQGAVWLQLVVTRTGTPSEVRVIRSLDPGLDEEAVKAVGQWRFAPGMLSGSPVDVQVVVVMDFWIH